MAEELPEEPTPTPPPVNPVRVKFLRKAAQTSHAAGNQLNELLALAQSAQDLAFEFNEADALAAGVDPADVGVVLGAVPAIKAILDNGDGTVRKALTRLAASWEAR